MTTNSKNATRALAPENHAGAVPVQAAAEPITDMQEAGEAAPIEDADDSAEVGHG